jgi:hypothetical protein
VVRLRDGLAVYWREPGASQVGLDARCRAVLDGLSEAEQHLLDLLRADPSVADLVRAARARGLPPDGVRALLARLDGAGVLAPAPAPRGVRKGSDVRAEAWAPDGAYWARLRPDGDGWAVARGRAARTVAVLGGCRVGMLVATGLAVAGVGTVLLDDDAAVSPLDVGPGSYEQADVRRPRAEAAARTLRRWVPAVRTSAAASTAPDLTILVEHGVANPVRARPLVREDLAHLSVVVTEVDVVVGPLVVPGEGPCLRCLDLARCDEDPRWPAVATQVAAAPPAGVEASLGPLAAALAVGQALAHLDGRDVRVRGATLEVDARDPVPRRSARPAHPECGCAGVPAGEARRPVR